MKGLIVQLAGSEPSLGRRDGKRERGRKVGIWLFYCGPSSPMLCSSCKRTSQNKSEMPRAILLSAHTRLHLCTQTQTCAERPHRCLHSSTWAASHICLTAMLALVSVCFGRLWNLTGGSLWGSTAPSELPNDEA